MWRLKQAKRPLLALVLKTGLAALAAPAPDVTTPNISAQTATTAMAERIPLLMARNCDMNVS
jgi:hypothetical protein